MAHPVAEETFLLLEKGDLLQLSNNNMKVKQKIIKEYKKLKKYQKSSLFELEKLSGQETQIDKLVDEYGIDPEAIE